ncbi:MAG: hypothetical protein ABGY75_18550, partial [Gemmataceae bacterium]
HQIATHKKNEAYLDPDSWQATAVHHERSWWPCWLEWLDLQSIEMAPPPAMGDHPGCRLSPGVGISPMAGSRARFGRERERVC